MKKILQDFKNFALRGNVIDLAVGVIIGAAFQGIVKSLVDDIISPIIGLFANMDFNELAFNVNDISIKYGSFITSVINFIIMAVIVFLMVKGINKLTSLGSLIKPAQEEVEKEPTTKNCVYCLSQIPIKAVRCPHCTSQLETQETPN